MFPLRSSGAGSCSCRSTTECLLSVSRGGSWRPPVAAAAGWRQPAAAPPGRQRRWGSQPPAAVPELLLATLEAASAVSETGMLAGTFEPRPPGPEIGIAAAFAATPPVLFWLRIARSQLKRQKEIDEAAAAEELKQREREVIINCVWGSIVCGAALCVRSGELETVGRAQAGAPCCAQFIPPAARLLRAGAQAEDHWAVRLQVMSCARPVTAVQACGAFHCISTSEAAAAPLQLNPAECCHVPYLSALCNIPPPHGATRCAPCHSLSPRSPVIPSFKFSDAGFTPGSQAGSADHLEKVCVWSVGIKSEVCKGLKKAEEGAPLVWGCRGRRCRAWGNHHFPVLKSSMQLCA
jgi:hypothetical protein